MKLSFLSPAVVALLGFMLINPLHAADAAAAPKEKKIPFHGKIEAVDVAAQTITVGGTKRVFHVLPTTTITDGTGAASTFAAAKIGEDCGGSYTKEADGALNLHSVRFGAKTGSKEAAAAAAPAPTPAAAPAPAPKPAPVAAAPVAAAPEKAAATADAKAKKQMFAGKVVSVDAGSSTIIVHGKQDQTFTVTPETKISGAATSLAAITAGEHVKGSYMKSADGATLTIASLNVGK